MTQLKDSMSNVDKIRQEIERLKKILEESTYYLDNSQQALGYSFALDDFKEFIDSLPEEKPSEDLEDAAEKYSDKYCSDWAYRLEYEDAFIAGAEWQANQPLKGSPLPEDTVLFQKGVEEGRRLEKDDLALTWEDIKSIVQIADKMLDDPKARVEYQNHNEEYYYKRVLEKYEADSEG